MNYETVKIGNITYKVAQKGYNLSQIGGTIAIILEQHTMDSIHTNLLNNTKIIKYDKDGNQEGIRGDLVYSGEMNRVGDYLVGVEQTQIGTNPDGSAIYKTTNITAPVVVCKYKSIDLAYEITKIKEQLTAVNNATVELFINILPALQI